MIDKINLKILSATGNLFEQPVDMAVLPGYAGDMGILPRHAPLIAQLQSGVVRLYNDDVVVQQIFVTDGFADIDDAGCRVLVDQWIPLDKLNKDELTKQLESIKHDFGLTDDPVVGQVLQKHIANIEIQLKCLE